MNTLFVYIAFLGLCIGCCPTKDKQENKDLPFTPARSLCAQYATKPSRQIFYTDRRLNLNADSTFSFAAYTCTGIDTSFGRWVFNNKVITLLANDSLRRIIERQKTFTNLLYLDLNEESLIVQGDALRWISSKGWTDTLLRQ